MLPDDLRSYKHPENDLFGVFSLCFLALHPDCLFDFLDSCRS